VAVTLKVATPAALIASFSVTPAAAVELSPIITALIFVASPLNVSVSSLASAVVNLPHTNFAPPVALVVLLFFAWKPSRAPGYEPDAAPPSSHAVSSTDVPAYKSRLKSSVNTALPLVVYVIC
jgi:hypothetical protein